jgi:PIN domain nuclease of toxin-antitoxin system
MRLLLDTHALIGAISEPQFLSSLATALLEDVANEIFASAASAYEIGLKYNQGKWPEVQQLALDFEGIVALAGFQVLVLSGAQASTAAALPLTHRDPFDRLIAAQAINLAIPLLSADAKLDQFTSNRIW